MTDRNLSDCDLKLQPLAQEFLDKCHAAGIDAFITQTYRPSDEQDADYAKGRTKPGNIITNARGGQSPHNCTDISGKPASKAFDFAIQNEDGTLDWNPADPEWVTAISIGESLGLISGSSWHSLKDTPHMELSGFKSTT